MSRDIATFLEFCNPTPEEKVIRDLVADFYAEQGDLKDFGITHVLCSEKTITIATTRPGYVIGRFGKLITDLKKYIQHYVVEEIGYTGGQTPLQCIYDKINIVEVTPLMHWTPRDMEQL